MLLMNVRVSLPKQPQTCGIPKSQLMRPSVHRGWMHCRMNVTQFAALKNMLHNGEKKKKPTEVKRPTLNTLTIAPDNTHTAERSTTKNLFYLTYFFTIKKYPPAISSTYKQCEQASERARTFTCPILVRPYVARFFSYFHWFSPLSSSVLHIPNAYRSSVEMKFLSRATKCDFMHSCLAHSLAHCYGTFNCWMLSNQKKFHEETTARKKIVY